MSPPLSRAETLGGSHLGGAWTLGTLLNLEFDPLATDEPIKVER